MGSAVSAAAAAAKERKEKKKLDSKSKVDAASASRPGLPDSITPLSNGATGGSQGADGAEVANAASNTISRASLSQSPAEQEYTGAPLPLNEAERHGYLCSLGILDTEPERRFDDITKLSCMVFKVPIALVSLVDKERQWFKSVQGLPSNETDRKSSFCAWTLLPQHPEVLVVENALEDVRFRNNPLVVGFPNIRFYAGCPLVASNKARLGSLCIIDNKARVFDAESCQLLANMAEMVVREIEKDKVLAVQAHKSALLTQENTQLLRAMDCFNEGIMLCNMSLPRWQVLFVNEAWERVTDLDRDAVLGISFWDLFQVTDGAEEASRKRYTTAFENQESFEMTVCYNSGSRRKWLSMIFRCANSMTVDNFMPLVGIPSILAATPQKGGPLYYFATVSKQAYPSSEVSSVAKQRSFSLVPTKVDPFDDVRLGPLLGKGSYGRVYRGQWNGAQVAVKVLETVARDDGEAVLEAVLSGQISHPNVVQTYKWCMRASNDVGVEADNEGCSMVETWMIMEFCNKGSVSDAVDRGWFRKRHSLFEADYKSIIYTAREIASAMCYLHQRGILHGDLSGNNVLLGSSEKDERRFTAKVADFGLSRVLDNREAITTRTFGTVTHMPPELLVDGLLSKSTDVWSFGVIVWEMYTGQRPYAGLTHGQILHHITSGKGLTVSGSCPQPLREFILRLMSKDPAGRPNFQEVVEQLDELEQELC